MEAWKTTKKLMFQIKKNHIFQKNYIFQKTHIFQKKIKTLILIYFLNSLRPALCKTFYLFLHVRGGGRRKNCGPDDKCAGGVPKCHCKLPNWYQTPFIILPKAFVQIFTGKWFWLVQFPNTSPLHKKQKGGLRFLLQ